MNTYFKPKFRIGTKLVARDLLFKDDWEVLEITGYENLSSENVVYNVVVHVHGNRMRLSLPYQLDEEQIEDRFLQIVE